MRRHVVKICFSLLLLALLLAPITVPNGRSNQVSESSPISEGSAKASGANVTWHDDCASTNGWVEQNPSSGFDPKHEIFESGTLQTSSGYLMVTGIADPVTARKGPLFIKELTTPVPIDSIQMFQAEFSFTYASQIEGFLAVYLFDQNQQKAVVLRLHDAWAASESHPESVYFTPGETGDGAIHDEILFGSWTGYIRFWYDENTGSLVGELDPGTPNRATLKAAGQFNPNRQIKYIGIQWSRHPGVPYDGNNYRLLDLQVTYDISKISSEWLQGWSYRVPHQIIGTPGAGTDYQVQIIARYGNGPDSGNTAYCNFACQPDFDDIRFTGRDGITLLDYWRESCYGSDNATFWVKVSDDLNMDAWIYMYYGNSTCSTTSNGTATFIFFDDFSGSSIDLSKWNAFGPWTEAGGVASFSITGNGGMSILPSLQTDSSWDMRNKSFVSRWRYTEKSVNREWGMSCANTVGDDHTELAYFLANANLTDNIFVLYYDVSDAPGYEVFTNPGPVWSVGQFYKTEFASTPNGTLKNQWILDDNPVFSYSDYAFNDDPQYIFLGFYVYGYSNTLWSGNLGMEFDYIFLRKTVAPEPGQGAWSTACSWHNDCSNTTGFTYNGSWNTNWGDPWTTQNGTLESDGSMLSITDAGSGTGYHGPVFEYKLPSGIRLRNIKSFSAVMHADNSLQTYLGTNVVMLGDQDRNPVLFFSIMDGWKDYTQGAYGVSYVFLNLSRSSFGSGYPVTWTEFNGMMNASFTDQGLLASVEGVGDMILPGLQSADLDRVVKYVAIGYAGYASYPLLPVQVDDISLTWGASINPTHPSIDSPEDVQYEAGTSGNNIVWTVSGFNPTTYELYRNGSLLESNIWTGSSSIDVGVNNLYPGNYNYTIVIYGDGGAHVADTVFVSVRDTTAPSLGHPSNKIVEYGSSTSPLQWSVSDLYPGNYMLYIDGAFATSDSWSSGSISEAIEGLDLGTHTFTITVFDAFGNAASNTVIVRVVDTTPPIITHPSDFTVTSGSTDIPFNWTVTDLLPNIYRLYMNGSIVDSGTWSSGDNITVTGLGTLSAGVYNYTLVVFDTSGNRAVDTVFVVVVQPWYAGGEGMVAISVTAGGFLVIIIVGALIVRNKGQQPSYSDYYYSG